MKNLIIIITLSILIQSTIFSQYGSKSEMPLAIGNQWLYKIIQDGPGPDSTFYRLSVITKDTIANGKQYYYCKFFWGDDQDYFIRYNEETGALVRFVSNYCNNEIELLKLKVSPGDSGGVCSQYDYYFNGYIDTNIWGFSSYLKDYSKYTSVYHCVYAKNYRFFSKIGPYYKYTYSFCRLGFSNTNQLKGAVINGIVYGDTAVPDVVNSDVSIRNINEHLKYSLNQNYPNPFNPITDIKFNIPISSKVKLVIYNATGIEIEVLLDKYLESGEHSILWNATSYPSGIYFYKIQAGDPSTGSGRGFVETKKMVLIK